MTKLNDAGLVGLSNYGDDLFAERREALEALRRGLIVHAEDASHLLGNIPPPTPEIEKTRALVRELRREAQTLVVCGIGGSSLGGRVLCAGNPGVVFLEGTDPRTVARVLKSVDWGHAALNIISKSGGTLETLVNAGLCMEWLRKAHPETWRRRVVVTASPGDGRLQRWAQAEGVSVLRLPDAVGGRYSVLTQVGLFPAAFAGVDPAALAEGARAGADAALLRSGRENPAMALALALVELFREGRTEVDLWGYGEQCHLFALWVQQLWGESLGRRIVTPSGEVIHTGTTPLACRGSEDQHSLLQLFTDGPPNRWVLFLTAPEPGASLSREVREFAGLSAKVNQLGLVQQALWEGTALGLTEAGVPVAGFDFGAADARALGEAFYIFQAATLYAAGLLGIDPFGQPGVETGKRHTRNILDQRG